MRNCNDRGRFARVGEVLKIIRICRPQMKVMVVSGHITPSARTEFEQLGQRDFVQKPYRLDELGRTLRRLLDARTSPTP